MVTRNGVIKRGKLGTYGNIYLKKNIYDHLVGGLNPSEKYQSVGIIIPSIWENKIDVPNHQPVIYVDRGILAIPKDAKG